LAIRNRKIKRFLLADIEVDMLYCQGHKKAQNIKHQHVAGSKRRSAD
jgi:hypothetical protein